jgi:mRNA interferase RelE/StbE
MASYRIAWRKSTKKDLRRIPPVEVAKIIRAVESLGTDPFPTGHKKLSGSQRAYRIRVGDYRIIYEVHGSVLLIDVVRVGHRRDVYQS